MKIRAHLSRAVTAYAPAIILATALIAGLYVLNHSAMLKDSVATAQAKFTDTSPSGLEVVPASGGSQVSYQTSYETSYGTTCTPNTWDSQNCRRCTAGGTWAANCTDYGGPGDPGYTNALWCSCSVRCTGGPNTCQAITASLSGSPTSVVSGNPVTLSWSSTYADTCTSGTFNTNGLTSGSVTVYPAVNTTYDLTCSNTGGSVNRFQAITVSQPPPCTLPWGGTIASGQSTTAYQASSVPYGSSCTSQTRSCSNGTLSGTYQYQSCTVQSASACSLPWGGTIASGQSTTAYQASSVPYGSSCTSQTRSCSNGTLSGTYQYQSCTVNPPPAPTCSVSIVPNPIARGGSATVSWTSANATTFTLTTIGPVTPNTSNSTSVSPSANTNYGGTATGPGGTITCPATLTVTQPTADMTVLKL